MKNTTEPVSVRFTTRGRVVIPLAFRRQFGIRDGTRAAVAVKPDGILIQPGTEVMTRRARGIIKRRSHA